MARPLRLQFEHALYHVTSRGNARQAIVKTQADRQAFLDGLAQVVDRFGWRCHAYCLMNNHYHVLVERFGVRSCNTIFRTYRLHPWLARFDFNLNMRSIT